MASISYLLKQSTEKLESVSDSPRLDAEVLLSFVLEKDRSYFMTWPEKELSDQQLEKFYALEKKRLQGAPIAHLTGEKEFWSLNLNITKDTLIPRPETELLVEQIINAYPAEDTKHLLDLGTGSGAIALAIASEKKNWLITATDQSESALEIAKQNAAKLNLANVQFTQSDWFQNLANKKFDIIVSNPPYIASDDPHLKQGDVRFEPLTALASGSDGLDDIREIVAHAKNHLNPDGMLAVEHGYDQKDAVYEIFIKNGFMKIMQTTDLSNNPRTTLGFLSN